MAPPRTYPPYQQALLDGTGHVSKPWHRFFLSLIGAEAVQALRLHPGGSDGDVQYNDDGVLAGQPIDQFGYWTPITDGVTPIPELLFDAVGDCVVGFVPTP